MNGMNFPPPSSQIEEPSSGERDAAAIKFANRARLLSHHLSRNQSTENRQTYLAFNGGRDRYGIPLSEVLEIQALEFFSPVPRTPSFIAGVIHWRGVVLSLLDLGKLFQSSQEGLADYHTALIVEAAGVRVAIIAREVEELLNISSDDVKPAPKQACGLPAGWVSGVYDENRLLLQMTQILADAKLVNWRQT